MIFKELRLHGAYQILMEPFVDRRGEFSRLFCADEFQKQNLISTWVQVNRSVTRLSGTIRGMHFQYAPAAEVKLLSCFVGEVYDVIVDIRQNSPTYGHWCAEILRGDDNKFLYVPEGFAHGFQTLTDNVEMLYFHSVAHNPNAQGGIAWDDPDMKISWPRKVVNLSPKDSQLPRLKEMRPFKP